jgi:2-polyprenyl-6-methoxyphenol hydroxylase-like FAD-dependent oxidoreductase
VKPIEHTDVLVLGGGPVGLFAALRLSENGVRVRIVDMYRRTALQSYALALHPQSLRLLDDVSLAQAVLDHGRAVERIGVYDHARRLATIDVSPVGGPHPFIVVLPQSVLESALERRLNDNGVRVEWGRQALAFDDGADGVMTLVASVPDAEVEAPEDLETARITSEFLIGADGYHSLTRRLLGVEQDSAGEAALGLLEFEAPIEDPGEMRLVLGPASSGVFWPLGPGRGRWSMQLDDPADCREADDLKRLVQARAPWFGDAFGTVAWFTTLSYERRLARRFGCGRVWLAGDAARFTSPLGVQSMNVGLREAHDLARRMAEILSGKGSPKLLDYYNEERQREWKMLLGVQDRVRRARDAPEWTGPLAARLVSTLPASGRDLNVLLEQVGLRLDWLRRKKRA